MLQIKRAGHSTLTTPDIERTIDYFTRIVGLSLAAREKNRAILATKSGLEAIVLERGGDVDAPRLSLQVAPGSDIPQAKALDYVACYALGLDMTVRGREDRSFRKSVDGYAVLGPWMVTADELPDPDNVPISLTVNGETKQNSNTSQLIYNCRRLIEFASEFYTLYPGDLVYTGTPDGVGPVKPGDVIVCRSAPVLGELKIAVRAHEAGRVPSEARVPA